MQTVKQLSFQETTSQLKHTTNIFLTVVLKLYPQSIENSTPNKTFNISVPIYIYTTHIIVIINVPKIILQLCG